MIKTMDRHVGIAILLSALALLASLCGCIDAKPVCREDITPPPAATVAPEVTDEPEPTVAEPTDTPAPTMPPADAADALGNPISGAEHFMRYITFKDLIVYEQEGGTFLDGIVSNAYPEPITCAVSIVYYDEGGGVLARAQLQTRDGKYLLVLEPGDTVVYAHILTDITLTGLEYVLEFDASTGIHP